MLNASAKPNSHSCIEKQDTDAFGASQAHSGVGEHRRAEVHDLALQNRVARVQGDLRAGRTVSDADLIQHRADCTRLMEAAAELWLQGCESRETVEIWQARALEAHSMLSPAWKAAREAQIQQAIGQGCFFVEQGDAARARIGGRG